MDRMNIIKIGVFGGYLSFLIEFYVFILVFEGYILLVFR